MPVITWGSKDKWFYYQEDTRAMVLVYNFLAVLWLFQLAWGLKYFNAVKDQDGEWITTSQLTPQQVQEMQVQKVVPLNWFRRWGLLILLGGIAIALGVTVLPTLW